MSYTVTWESGPGFYARFTDWVTPQTAAQVAVELTADPRYYSLRYAIIDLTDSPGHLFRRDDRDAIGNAMVQSIGAGLTTRPFRIFPTLAAARQWFAEQLPVA